MFRYASFASRATLTDDNSSEDRSLRRLVEVNRAIVSWAILRNSTAMLRCAPFGSCGIVRGGWATVRNDFPVTWATVKVEKAMVMWATCGNRFIC